MALGQRDRSLAPVRVVSLSLLFGTAAVLAGLAMSGGRMASAQAPDQAYWLPADSAIDEGDGFLVPPDSEVGLPILWPPGSDPMLLGGGWPTVEVIRPCLVWNEQEEDWDYDWDPALCPRKKAPGNSQGVCLVASGGPQGGGTYNWDFDETQHNDVPFYQSTQTGQTYYTWVSYTNWGKTSEEADTGYIRVFDADLTLEGGSSDCQNTVEDDPGFFMAVGPTRKSLAISLTPAEPDDVMPSSFDEELTLRGLLPPYQVTLGATGCVSFYSGPTGGEALTGDDLAWGWKEIDPNYFQEFDTPGQLYVQANSPGTATITLGLTFWCPQECGDWLAENGYAEDQVKVTVVDVAIEADLKDLPPSGKTYASGINPNSIILKLNGVQVTPTITDIAGGKHIHYLPSLSEVNLPGTNTVQVTVRDNANDGVQEGQNPNEGGNPTAPDPFTWSFNLP